MRPQAPGPLLIGCRRLAGRPLAGGLGQCRRYAAPAKRLKGKGVAAISTKKQLEVEKDTEKLASHLCINYLVDGQYQALKPDSEYPDWLFSLSTELEPRPLDECEPDSEKYWRAVIGSHLREAFRLARMDGWVQKDKLRNACQLRKFYGDAWCQEIERQSLGS